MKEMIHRHTISFKHAFAGLAWALRTQPNFRIHLLFTVLALGLSAYFQISRTEWAVIMFTIVLGLSAELINTAIESMTDLITTEWRQQAKVAKDVAAAMMLTTAVGAVIVAFIIFGHYL